MPQITTDEWLAEIERLKNEFDDNQGEVYTTYELCDKWQCGECKVRRILREAKKLNKLEVTKKRVTGIDDRVSLQNAYRLI